MRTTEILRQEHHWVLRMLECLERLVADAAEREAVDTESALELLQLFESFADGRHQEKEERYLFPRLMVLGTARDSEVVHRLSKEHAGDRRSLITMRARLLGAVQGDPIGVREFAREAGEYAAAQRRHMTVENAVLLPMAERLLTRTEDDQIVEGFARIEAGGPPTEGWAFGRIESLCRRLGVPVAERQGGTGT